MEVMEVAAVNQAGAVSKNDDRIMEHFSPRLHQALTEACAENKSLRSVFLNTLPVRLASVLMLPYTLPVESAISLTVRILEWLPDLPSDVDWMKDQISNILWYFVKNAKARLGHSLSARLHYNLEFHRTRSLFLPSRGLSSYESVRRWVRSNTSVMDLIVKCEEYQRQLWPGKLHIDLQMQATIFQEELETTGLEMKPSLPSLGARAFEH